MSGDGVNVAARLQAFAPPGGALISESVRALGPNALYKLVDVGLQRMKNISEPIRAFRVDPASSPQPAIKPVRAR